MSQPHGTTNIHGNAITLTPDGLLLYGAQDAQVEHGSFEVEVTSAELLALFATAKELIPAPGAGKFLVLKWAMLFLDYGGTAYGGIAAGEDLVIAYTNVSGVAATEIETTGFLDATADAYRLAYPHTGAVSVDSAMVPVANAALVLALLTAEIITGNSPLFVKGEYQIMGF